MLQSAGLDPTQHDVPELHAAWLLLDSHMQRLRMPPVADEERHTDRLPGIQPLAVFNPHEVVRTSKVNES